MTPTPSSGSDAWVERALRAWFRHRPVDATFVGLHDHDARLPDLSPAGVEKAADELRALLAEAPPAEPDPADPLGTTWLDARLASGALRIALREHETGWTRRNPSAHAGDAVFGLMSLLLPASAPPDGGEAALVARMEGLGAFLDGARAHLDRSPRWWTERALRECRGGLAFLREGLPHACPDPSAGFRAASARAEGALASYADFLRSELLARPSDDVACGGETFELLLREGHALRRDADDIAAYAREEIDRTRAWLEENATDHGADTPEGVLARLADIHPSAEGYLSRFGEIWHETKALAEARDLLTWPDFPIRYVERPAWSRAAAPDLYFLFYRSPAAYDRPPVHDYLVAPLDRDAGPEAVEAFLRANNDAVIRLNHVVHHGGIGHHVQNWHAFRSPLRVGRVAAVDAAYRISLFCGGTMAEGWACYATDLMAEAGGLTPLEVYAEHAGRVRMAARAVVDVELHHGRMTLDEAAAYYIETAGMAESAARAEAVKNSMFPGAALMYLVGTDAIHQLRAELMGLLGDRFSLRAFHDDFLSWGSIPVRLIADEMVRRARAGLPTNAHARSG